MKTKKTMTRRDLLVATGIGVGVGLGLTAGGFVLAEKNIWPFNSSKAGTRAAFPRAARTGRVKEYTFEAAPATIMIGEKQVATWAYNGAIPGPEVRIMEGDTLRVTVKNRLQNQGTSVHWHGVPLVNPMDGVPGATQTEIAPGHDFVYEYVAPTAGTYFYHSHVGLQLDRGLYGPLIIESASEQKSYDQDIALVLDDWLDGMPGTPDDTMKKLIAGGDTMNMGGMGMGMSTMNMPPDLVYPTYLINGKSSEQPMEITVKKGQKIRLRFINAAASTIFHIALQGHQMTVTHTDGQPVEPVVVDTLRIGMGERYDVLVTANNPGVWQLSASVEGATPQVRALFRYQGSTGQTPTALFVPPELKGKMLQYAMLKAAATSVVPPVDTPDLVVPLQLSGGNGQYLWKINGQVFDQADVIAIPKLSFISFQYENRSQMVHPMHLHGHFFQLENGTGRGPLKDTVLVNPMQKITTNWVSDNPGTWAYHCHNAYHQMAGMMRFVKVS